MSRKEDEEECVWLGGKITFKGLLSFWKKNHYFFAWKRGKNDRNGKISKGNGVCAIGTKHESAQDERIGNLEIKVEITILQVKDKQPKRFLLVLFY